MIRLDATTRSLQFLLGASTATTSLVSYITYKIKTANEVQPERGGVSVARNNNSTAVTALSAPPQNTVYEVDLWTINDTDTSSSRVTMQMVDATTTYPLETRTVSSGQSLFYAYGRGFDVS